MKNVNNWKANLLFVLTLFLTLFASFFVKFQIDKKDEAEFRFECKEISSKIDLRLHAHAQLLRSGAAFFSVSDTVKRETWSNFIKQSKVALNLPGILGTGFSLLVPKNQLENHILQIRNEGFPDYKVWPESSKDTSTAIIFLEPFSQQNMRAFGFDMSSESVRREAMERARDLDIAALSGKILLVQETKTDVQAGNLMYVPVYRKGAVTNTVEQRRSAIIGWVYSPYRMTDLMLGILKDWELNDNKKLFSLNIFDGKICSAKSLLFNSLKDEKQEDLKNIRFSLKVPIEFNGHQWTLVFVQKKENFIVEYIASWLVFIGGLIISILLLLLSKSMLSTKLKAQQIAEELTSELKESERLLKESQEIARLGTYSLDLKRGLWRSSEILDAIFGIDENYTHTTEGWSAMIHPDHRELLLNYFQNETIAQGLPFNKEYKIIRSCNKEERWVHGLGKLEFDNNNNPIRLIGTISDITERKLAEEQLNLSREQYRSLFENSPLGIYQTTPDGKILNANKALLEMLEFESLTELQNRTLETEGYSKESSVNRKQFVEMIEKDGYVKGLEENWTTKSGQTIPIRENARIVKGINGKVFFEGTVEDISERKKTEKQLLLSQEQYTIAVEGSNDGIWDWDIISNEVYFSPRWKNMLGYNDEELENSFSTWETLLHPEDHKQALTVVQAYFDNEIPEYEMEFRMKHKDDSYRWILARGKALRHENGNPYRMAGSHTDITERKLVEKELKESEKRLRSIIESSPIPMVITKVSEGIILMANESLGKLFKISLSDAIGQKSPDFYSNSQDRKKLFKILMKDGVVDNYELVLKKSDQELFWGSVSLKLMTLDNEQVLIAGFHDITEMKNAEEEIMKHREHLEEMVYERTRELTISQQQLQQSLKDITDYKFALDESSLVAITDHKGVINYANDIFCKISKYNREELIGSTHRIINSDYHSSDFFIDLWRTISKGKVWRGEVKNKAKDGSFYWVDSTIVPFLDEQGKPYQYVSVRFDITDKKKSEENLIKARDAANSANQAKSEFLANMSHEIRTPMNAVIGFSELLSKTVKDEKQRSQVESIRSSGKNLLKIINDILDLSKIEAGKVDIIPVPVNLYSLTREIKNLFGPKVNEKKIDFFIEYESTIPKLLLLDEVRLRQILFNLIGNALKFTDKGHVILTVDAHRNIKLKDNYDLIIHVEDTGIGIPTDQQKLVFEPFTQQAGQSAKYGGTGLGLAITKKLIEKMGGRIHLESEVGKGSNITIVIPNISISEAEIEPAERLFDPTIIKFNEAKILLVDDNELNRELIKDMLEHSQLDVFEAENGEEAVQLATKNLPDLILMDLRMPVMDGYQATEILKQTKSTESIPVIAISASAKSVITGNRNLEMFNEFLMKPLDAFDLFDKMKKYLTYQDKDEVATADSKQTDIVLTQEQLNQLPELITVLENKFGPICQDAIKSQMIDQIEEFGKDLVTLANEINIQFFKDYANKICVFADNFEIDKLLKTLERFPKIIHQLKINNNNINRNGKN
ncbi:PAS domain S-box protein [Labilibaculum sp. K2S]|uniref:PAS domain S-box protein n=1 Tax=Labilibaculum sp. K2S TaxID=3056386 RepID=UPI0025A36216|nr:PAS domain S-box protein [Labilibaculum sp. K2S]MDM8161562.1 PAS domain S-box protein [Labilibaculum sp. K2S]